MKISSYIISTQSKIKTTQMLAIHGFQIDRSWLLPSMPVTDGATFHLQIFKGEIPS